MSTEPSVKRLTFAELNAPRPRPRPPGMSPETFADLGLRRELIGGHFYPLDVRRALDRHKSRVYIEKAVAMARREPNSARNMLVSKAERARRRQALRELREMERSLLRRM